MVSLVSFSTRTPGVSPTSWPAWSVTTASATRKLRDASCRFAAALAGLGLQPGDRISPYLPNSAAYAVKPGFHCVTTHWIRGFMAFWPAQRRRSVRLTVPM